MSSSSVPEKSQNQPPSLLGDNFPNVSSYLAPGMLELNYHQDLAKTKALASRVLKDPLLLQKLCDRVYELMLEDISRQKERIDNYRRFY